MVDGCVSQWALPIVIVIVLMAIYWACVIVASIRSIWQLKSSSLAFQESEIGGKLKIWLKDTWRRKGCYLEILPHITDQCTDIGVVLEFYYIADAGTCTSINMWSVFVVSVLILIEYRLLSSTLIFYYTRNWKQFFFQLADIEIIHALLINYKTNAIKPCTPQKWISMLEATFESAPQAIVQLVYLLATGIFFSEFGVVQISMAWSVMTVVLRNLTEDDKSFETAKSERLIHRLREDGVPENTWPSIPHTWKVLFPLRLCDVLARVFVLSLSYVLMPWFLFFIILGAEAGGLIYLAFKTQHYELLNHFIRCELSDRRYILERVGMNCFMLGLSVVIRLYFEEDFYENEAILISLIVTALLVAAFYYIYKTFVYEPVVWLQEYNARYFGEEYIFHQSKDISHLVASHHWNAILDLIYFGFNITAKQLIEKKPNLLELLSEDFIEGRNLLTYLMGEADLDDKLYNDVWAGTVQAYENNASRNESDYKDIVRMLQTMMGNGKQMKTEYVDDGGEERTNNIECQSSRININHQTTHNKKSILHVLCMKRHFNNEFFELLMNDSSLDPNILDIKHETPLHITAKPYETQLFAEVKVDENKEEEKDINIIISTEYDSIESQVEITQKLMSLSTININTGGSLINSETPMHYCIKYSNEPITKMYLGNKDLNIHQTLDTGDTYLHWVAQQPSENIALMLLSADDNPIHGIPDVNAQELQDGNTALHLSCAKTNFFGALVNTKDIDINMHNTRDGSCAIHMAGEYRGSNGALEILLNEQNIEINSNDNAGNTVLHRTVYITKNIANEYSEHLNLLMKHPQIAVNAMNNVQYGGYAALHVCYVRDAPFNNIEILLAHYDLNVNIQSLQNADSALHFAVNLQLWSSTNIRQPKLELLLQQNKIQMRLRNNRNETPESISVQQVRETQLRLQREEEELRRRERELENARRELERQERDYQMKSNAYFAAKSEYDRKKNEYDLQMREFNRDRQGNRRPQQSIYSSEKSRMDSAQRAMDDAQRRRDAAQKEVSRCQNRVDEQRREVEKWQRLLRNAQTILGVLQSYLNRG